MLAWTLGGEIARERKGRVCERLVEELIYTHTRRRDGMTGDGVGDRKTLADRVEEEGIIK